MPQIGVNVNQLQQFIRACRLCPRQCGVDRTAGEFGSCKTGALARIASYGPHFGEEDVLVGRGGSGTVFFSGCNMACVFCQNHDISQAICGRETSPGELADLMLSLQQQGCENVNLVTPTHVTHAAAEAILLARSRGLTVPVVYNCGGYESVKVLSLLDGLIEIYMPDFKYADAAAGLKYSGAPDYPAIAEAALAEMYRQVGPLQLDKRGVATHGVLVRHLVMPGELARGRAVIDAVARAAPSTTINVMGQYRPAHRAGEFAELMHCPEEQEIRLLRTYAQERGLIDISG
ncbi:MAG: radical SAM protein [Tepidisphaeraceae bacterium]|jgi:putative pyruvate formate lyase activating enzyme